MKWITEGFEGFSKGTMENGGQNLYVSKKGVLQRIFQYDVNQDGYADLLFANSQSMHERCPVHIYKDALNSKEFVALPALSSSGAIMADLFDSGYDDLVLACQHDGAHNDVPSIIYFGGPDGLTEKYRQELPAPMATGVRAADFNGDGKKELMFLSNEKLRMFYQVEKGFGPADFIDYNVDALCMSSGDLDGDGIEDVVFKTREGKVGVVFGGKGGLDVESIQYLETEKSKALAASGGSTAGWVDVSLEWKPNVVTINGVNYMFCVNGETAEFYTCDASRKLTKAFGMHCPGVMAVTAADLTGNGYDDLVVAVYEDKDRAADCRIYLGDADGLCADRYTTVPVICAVNVTVADMDGKKLIFTRSGARVEQEVPSPIFTVDAQGKATQVAEVIGGDLVMLASGKPAGKDGGTYIAVPNRTMNRKQGHEDVWVYLGGEDGFNPDRKLAFLGHSAVDGTMCDFFDTGLVDVLVTNCFEDAAFMDDGSYIYRNSENGFDPNNKVTIPTVRAHGCALADFNKDGYLDLAFGGFHNREIRIFYGSENGYSLENSKAFVLGPDDGNYKPVDFPEGAAWTDGVSEEEQKLLPEFGQVRWMLACDFNGDGHMDLFVSQITGPHCFIFWGDESGTFSKDRMTTLMTDGVAAANVADLDGDGYPDLLLAQHMSSKKNTKYEAYITVYWGGPDGYQENRKMQLPTICANAVTVGDYNANGSLDIYATAYQNGRVRDLLSCVYPGDKGNYSINNVKYLFNHSGSGCVSGDFNGDGYTDLAIACHKEYGNHVSHSFVFWGGPDGLSDDRKTILPTIGPHGMSTVDPGNIMDRGDRERYTSEAMTLPAGAKVKSIAWEGKCTSTSWVEVQLRCAADEASLKDAQWQDVESGADVSNLNITGVVQYRLALCAKCACGTPRITSVTVEY